MNQHAENNHALMLDVARDAIHRRAVKDGYVSEDYDAERDPEGYISSILNALHQWCHANGIDWDGELARAQGFFEQDIEGLEQEPMESLSKPSIAELRCPKCGHGDGFVIEVSERLLMFADGVVLHGDTGEEWGDWSHCRCHSCQHTGTVYQFRINKHTSKENTSKEDTTNG
jgi:hypothetical protein